MLGNHLKISIVAAALGMTACNGNTTETKLQYMPDMADNPTVKAQESYLNPPEHSVAVNAILYPESMETAEKEFQNPLPRNEDNIAAGKDLFETFCVVCHGPEGKGDGTLGASYPIPVPNITREELKARKDGFFFMKITYGQPQMPSYGHAISPHERWQIIHYLRTLQEK